MKCQFCKKEGIQPKNEKIHFDINNGLVTATRDYECPACNKIIFITKPESNL